MLAIAAFIALVQPCSAAFLTITPTLDVTAEEARERTESAKQSDSLIEGQGDRLVITYSSPVRINVDLAPQRRGSGYDPAEMLHFTLPPGSQSQATVDLTPTPGWSPFHQTYYITFFSPAGGEKAQIHNFDFLSWRWGSLLRAAVGHLAIRDQYQVSTYHALRGYNILSFPLSVIIGLATVLAMLLLFLLRDRRALTAMIMTLSLGTLAYVAWFGIDLARFTATNLQEWYGEHTYSKAGSSEDLAQAIRGEAAKSSVPLFVYVCHDTTDFYTKMLRYFLYPIPVSMKPEDIARATHIVVAYKLQWRYDRGELTCGNATGPAKKIAAFVDGSVLYSSTH